MKHFLDIFKGIIQELYGPNMVIGGMAALIQHGLITERNPADLDVIIFQPDLKQKNALKYFKHFDQIKDRPSHIEGYDDPKIRAYKFRKGDYYMDVIISNDSTPDDLLIYKHDGIEYKVNSIKQIIDAKRSYFFEAKKEDGLQKYVRAKDVKDFMALKQLNFNLE